MYRPRIIPVLLLKNGGLVKSVRFGKHRYIGDPINAVRIFNELKADELAFLDITATAEHRLVSLDLVKNVGEEANMPFSVAGGIRNLEDIRRIIEAGAEKVILNTIAWEDSSFVSNAAREFGCSTIVVCIDVKKNIWGKRFAWIRAGKKSTGVNPVDFAKLMEESGAGEILVQSIEKDGTMLGYDVPLIKEISDKVTIPVIALGGAGGIDHLKQMYESVVVNGLAAGSMFVYHGERKAVLVNYPEKEEMDTFFGWKGKE
jgi:imidazole glycerol-phosphate synthase subunit HisF